MTYIYKNIKSAVNTGSGIAEFMLIAPVVAFTEGGIQAPAAPFDLQPEGQQVQILTPHEFKPGLGFAKILFAPEKNSLSAKTIGDLMFQKQDFELKGFIPGSSAILHEAFFNWVNTPLIALTKDSNCPANMWYQLGNDCTSAFLKGDFTTGTTKDGVKGYDVTLSWQNPFVQLYAHVDGPEILAD